MKRRAKLQLYMREGFTRSFGLGWVCAICEIACGSNKTAWLHVRSDEHKENKIMKRLAK